MIEEAIVAALADLAAVYPVYLPERAGRPAITYRRISTTRTANHDGASELVTARFQLTAHAANHPEALNLARAIIPRFNDHRGPISPLATDPVDNTKVENELDLGYEMDAETWTATLDVIVNYKE